MSSTSWVRVVMADVEPAEPRQHFHCGRCEARLAIALPMPVTEFSEQARGFIDAHRACAVLTPAQLLGAISQLAHDLMACGYGAGDAPPESSEQLEWFEKATRARGRLIALAAQLHALLDAVATREADDTARIDLLERAYCGEGPRIDLTQHWRGSWRATLDSARTLAPPGAAVNPRSAEGET